MENELGRVREGYLADLILLDKNPLKNLKYFYPTGVIERQDGKLKRVGGVKWTIKDGYVYHAPTMLEDVKKIVLRAKRPT
jgi:imidazolonepropionase-like amidohydrolase